MPLKRKVFGVREKGEEKKKVTETTRREKDFAPSFAITFCVLRTPVVVLSLAIG